MEKSYNCCEFLTPRPDSYLFLSKTLAFIAFCQKQTVRKTIDFPDCCYSDIAIGLVVTSLFFQTDGSLKIFQICIDP